MQDKVMIPLAVVAAIFLIWLIATYNRFVGLRRYIESSWAGIDVELKRRHDLIPQLVQVVKGYAEYESNTLKDLVAARNAAVTPKQASARESDVTRDLRQLFLVAEAYPDLKANQQYLSLQRELAMTEDRIASARRLYNGNVRDFLALRDGFPSTIVAGTFGFRDNPEFFELAGDAERAVPRIDL